MSKIIDIIIPDIGDFDNVPVIEVLVNSGDSVAKEQSLLTLESEKATLEIPSPQAGTIKTLTVKEGDTVGQGTIVGTIQINETTEAPTAATTKPSTANTTAATDAVEMLVIGAGPGGYTAAFRAADLGMQTTLIERYDRLGGVCLNVGCIPSKALLHNAAVIRQAEQSAHHGVSFGKPKIDRQKLLDFKDQVVGKLTGGLAQMAKQRKVNRITGEAKFIDAHSVSVNGQTIRFKQCIIAAGSQAFKLPNLPWQDERLMDSTDALELKQIPKTMLIIGGGIIGLEMATVYSALGTQISIVEMADQIIPGADPDLVRPLLQQIKKQYQEIKLKTQVTQVTAQKSGLKVEFNGEQTATYDRVLVAVGRTPNGNKIDAQNAGVQVDEKGFIPVNQQMRTNIDHIYAIGDIVGQPMLAHKATHEAKVAAEAASGEKAFFDAQVIPSVAYTDPEVAWVGLTETQAKQQGIEYQIGKFPWAASGRALGNDRAEGFSKLLFDPQTDRILGAGIVGINAGELISELCLAIEMGCDATDIGLTIHPHPTLAESVAMSAEAYEGTITDLYMPKKK